MLKKRLCCDIDNVVARTDELIRKLILDFTGGRVNLTYEGIIEFDYCKCKDAKGNAITKAEWNMIHDLFAEPENLMKVEPYPSVQEHLKRLSEKYEIHLVTSRLPKARRTTVEWLEAHAFSPCGLHFLNPGEKHESLGRFEVAIEDNYEQGRAFVEAGIPCYLIKHPWNANGPAHPMLSWVNGWSELLVKLM